MDEVLIRLGYELIIQMAYDDYNPQSQGTCVRIESAIYEKLQEAEIVGELVANLADCYRGQGGEHFKVTVGNRRIELRLDDGYATIEGAEAEDLFWNMIENYGVKKPFRKPSKK
jgi:hypothetical protein